MAFLLVANLLSERRDSAFQVGVKAAFGGYLLAGMPYGGRVSLAELYAYLSQRATGLLPDKVHGYLPG